MDWRIYHAFNGWASQHTGVAHATDVLMNVCLVALVAGAVALWFAARPGGSSRRKLVAASALASGALGYAINQVIHAVHDRPRPYEAHDVAWHPYATGTDASFPSDHSSAAFGIAWGVFLLDRTLGAVFLAVATVLDVCRLTIGAHYPGDLLAGVAVGLFSAVLVVTLARPLLAALVGLVERLTDPLVRPLWRRG